MIGTSHEVDARLLRAEQDCELQESIVLEGRPELPTAAGTAHHHPARRPARRAVNQTRVVLGSSATGVTDVGDTLGTIAGRIADWTLPPVGKLSVWQELVGRSARERRVVISDFASLPGATGGVPQSPSTWPRRCCPPPGGDPRSSWSRTSRNWRCGAPC
ncbi:hypothetical protein LT493_02120 [Streptomyces tricolor]|nr:hypothetical protein [Streptomyces tricolor]